MFYFLGSSEDENVVELEESKYFFEELLRSNSVLVNKKKTCVSELYKSF